MKKTILKLMVALVVVGLATGCGAKNQNTPAGGKNEPTTTAKAKIKGNCHAVECINKIDTSATVEDINAVMGFEGTLTDEKYNIYKWEISDSESIEAKYYSGKTPTIIAHFDDDTIKNNKVDFSRWNELKPLISKGITYEDFITYIGGQEGVLVEKSSSSNKYRWVNSKGGYLAASFGATTKKCTFASGLM